MDAEFKRDMNCNYMVLNCSVSKISDNYQVGMIINNDINGFLKCTLKMVDSNTKFYYDIASRQPLTRIILRKQFTYIEIRKVIQQIKNIIESAWEYLLDENDIVFDADYIYVELDNFNLKFCYFPKWNKNVFDEIHKFTEFLMQNTNHGDKKAAVLVYGLFRVTMEENYCLKDIDELLNENNVILEVENNVDENKLENKKLNDNYKNNKKSEALKKSNKIVCEKTFELKNRNLTDGRLNIIAGFIIFIMILAYLYKKVLIVLFGQTLKLYIIGGFFVVILLIALVYNKIKGHKKYNSINDNSEWISECNKSNYTNESTNNKLEDELIGTSLLNQDSISFKQLVPENSLEYNNIVLEKYPFIIGKHTEHVDAVVKENYISRMHCQIECFDDSYFIKDLNSTNGTFLNGKIIEPSVCIKLEQFDKIRIGQAEYIFQ